MRIDEPDPAAPLADVEPAAMTAAAFDALGRHYEHAFRGLAELDAALARVLAALAPGSRVLDVGSGTGRPVAERLAAAGHDVTGIDVSPQMVEIAREQVPTARFLLADVRTHPSPEGSWDAVCAFFPLLTMPRRELDAVLARLAAWLVPGGRLAFATVPADVDDVPLEFLGQPVRGTSYPVETLLDRVRGAGLTIERSAVTHFQPDFPGAASEEHVFVDAVRPGVRGTQS